MKTFFQDGNNVDVLESLLVHPAHGDGLVDSGDQCAVGTLVGVAAVSAGAATDNIAVKTNGVHKLPVTAINAGGNSAVAIGDKIYLDLAAAAALNKKIANQPFGIALDAVVAGATTTIRVKVTGA
jgi:predicted RecA/RadA family phage recombinase